MSEDLRVSNIVSGFTTSLPTVEFNFLNTILEIPAFSDILTKAMVTKTLIDIEFWQKSFNKGLDYFDSLESHGYVFETELRNQIIKAINSYN